MSPSWWSWVLAYPGGTSHLPHAAWSALVHFAARNLSKNGLLSRKPQVNPDAQKMQNIEWSDTHGKVFKKNVFTSLQAYCMLSMMCRAPLESDRFKLIVAAVTHLENLELGCRTSRSRHVRVDEMLSCCESSQNSQMSRESPGSKTTNNKTSDAFCSIRKKSPSIEYSSVYHTKLYQFVKCIKINHSQISISKQNRQRCILLPADQDQRLGPWRLEQKTAREVLESEHKSSVSMHIMDVMLAAPAMSFPSHSKPMAMNTQPAARIWQWTQKEISSMHMHNK